MSDETFVTRAMEDQAEAEAFAGAVHQMIGDAYDATYRMICFSASGAWTIPPGTDCAAFEARIKAITADIENMMDGYAPGTREAA